MSMCRPIRVKHARVTPGLCQKCQAPIRAGEAYTWWKGRYTGKRVRCSRSICQPKSWELETNPTKATDIEGGFLLSEAQGADEAGQARDSLQSAISMAESIVEDLEERISNKEGTALEHTAEYETLEESRDNFKCWIDPANGVLDELEEMGDAPDPEDEGEESQLSYEEALANILNQLEEWPELDLGSYGPPRPKRKQKETVTP